MSNHRYMPDPANFPGYPEGQHNSVDTTSEVLQLNDRVDCLEELVSSLQKQIHTLELNSSSPPRSSCQLVHTSTQTDKHEFTSPTMDLDMLSEKIRICQKDDKDISTLKYFLDNNITPEAKEIPNFQPKMRRYLWHLTRFVVLDDIVYRKKTNSCHSDERLQLLVPANLVPDVLETVHPAVGHVRLERTLQMSQQFFWPFMQRDITNFSNTCNLCQHSTASTSEQPSSIFQKAVCAITELTKDYIHCTKPKDTTSVKRSRRRRNRFTPNDRADSTTDLHPQPPDDHLTLFQRDTTYRASRNTSMGSFPPQDHQQNSPTRSPHATPPRHHERSHHANSPTQSLHVDPPQRQLREFSSPPNSPTRNRHDHPAQRYRNRSSPVNSPTRIRYVDQAVRQHHERSTRADHQHKHPEDRHREHLAAREFYQHSPARDHWYRDYPRYSPPRDRDFNHGYHREHDREDEDHRHSSRGYRNYYSPRD